MLTTQICWYNPKENLPESINKSLIVSGTLIVSNIEVLFCIKDENNVCFSGKYLFEEQAFFISKYETKIPLSLITYWAYMPNNPNSEHKKLV